VTPTQFAEDHVFPKVAGDERDVVLHVIELPAGLGTLYLAGYWG
jgi:hypothetical protein